MAFNKMALLSLLVVFISCNRPVKTDVRKTVLVPRLIPTVNRTSNPKGFYPDFDTTLVAQYIRSIFQDSKGNLWFGSLEEGLIRYDKKSLTYFVENDGLNANSIHAIAEDKNGNLWLGTEQGAVKYDGKSFRTYTEKDGLSDVNIGRKSILADKTGTIWVGTEHGVFRYNPSADSTGEKCFSLFKQMATATIKDIVEDTAGNIWFATQNKGVFRFDGKAVENVSAKKGLGDNYAGGIVQDNAGNMWFTMKEGICRFDGTSFTEFTSKDGLGGSEIWGIYKERSGIIWITARGSTTRFNPDELNSGSFAFKVFTEADGINCCVQSMYQDQSGNMWWGAGSGLYRFDGKRFYQVKQTGPW